MILRLDSIHRKAGNLPEDDYRIGELYSVDRMEIGYGAILPYHHAHSKVLLTSKVTDIIADYNEYKLIMETVNTTYTFGLESK